MFVSNHAFFVMSTRVHHDFTESVSCFGYARQKIVKRVSVEAPAIDHASKSMWKCKFLPSVVPRRAGTQKLDTMDLLTKDWAFGGLPKNNQSSFGMRMHPHAKLPPQSRHNGVNLRVNMYVSMTIEMSEVHPRVHCLGDLRLEFFFNLGKVDASTEDQPSQ